jgi:Pentapeptide repeats (8 copies)
MGDQANQQTWWQKYGKLLIIIAAVFIVLAMLITVILLVLQFGWDWTGFIKPSKNSSFVKVTIKSTTRDIEEPPAKTLWDWLQLLFVPVVLAIAGFWLNHLQRSREDRIANRQKKIDQDIATDNQRENALQEYINKMSDLLLNGDLDVLKTQDKIRKIARARTLTVLLRLDGRRKRSILRFLSESGFLSKDNLIVSLVGADLSEADLSRAFLKKTDLRKTNLSKADLSGADLSEADLSEADLSGANLKDVVGITPEELEGKVKSLKGTTMPNGSTHS